MQQSTVGESQHENVTHILCLPSIHVQTIISLFLPWEFQDALMPKWSKLSEYVTLECDGVDFTPQLKKHKVHSVLFANIPSFGAGKQEQYYLR